MSEISATHHHGSHAEGHSHAEPQIAARSRLLPSAVTADRGTLRTVSMGMMFVGAIALVVLVILGFSAEGAGRQAIAAYHAGFLFCVGVALGCLGIQMILHQFNAGWSAAPRRTAEGIASLLPLCALLFVPVLVNALIGSDSTKLFKWMVPSYVAGDVLFEHKQGWLNVNFWIVRSAVYFGLWSMLALKLYQWSRKQDLSGDRWLTAKARRMSSYGLLIFALSSAFASFDWLMGLDFHWFSTMFGVYFFAGSVLSAICTIVLVLAMLSNAGKLKSVVTPEHFHDMGKMMLAFTVFWAYIAFCQYFLIWYSNIPEETAFYNLRQQGDWRYLSIFLVLGHFVVPFLVLLFRGVKRTPRLLAFVAAWLLIMHAVDLFYIVRPVIKESKLGERLIMDVFGIAGPALVFLGLAIRRVVSAPLIPLKDPRLHEALEHKNYV